LSRSKGDIAEQKSCEFLRSHGFSIIEQNFYAKKLGEIDIIASQKGIVHFIEVKSGSEYESAVNNITASKLSKLYRSIDYYIQHKNLQSDYQLDVIIVIEDNITHLKNITL
jgi:putative endonuclease